MRNSLKTASIIVSVLISPHYTLAGGCCSVPENDSPRARVIEESEHHSNSDNSIGFPDNTSQPEESPEVGSVLENPDLLNPSSPPYSPDSMTLRDFPFSSPYIVQEEG